MSYSRFAIYYVPPEGALADFGSAWLGWDVTRGRAVPQPDLPGLHDITMTARGYGFHATLKPPFRLTDGQDAAALARATADLAATCPAATCAGLTLAVLGGFLALVPTGDPAPLQALAAACVRDLDAFRAPAGADELARRRQAGLSPRQEAHLTRWGYPHVLEDFRFHMTLTARLPPDAQAGWRDRIARRLPPLPAPFVVDRIALCGERADKRFEVIQSYALAG